MKGSDGFTIVECMTYLCMSSFFIVLVLQTYLLLQKTVLERLTAAHEHVTLAVSIDTMMQDIASAPIDEKRWSSRGPHLIRWSDDHGNDNGFAFSNNNLLKIIRTRHEDGTLKGPAYCVLAHNIQGTFQVTTHDKLVQSVTMQATPLMGNKKQTVTMIMRPKAGIINA